MVAMDEHYPHGLYTDRAQAMLRESSIVQVVVSLDGAGGLGIGSPYSCARFAANFR